MPFKECSLVSQREEFCRLALAEGANIRGLCRRFGLGSPRTGYKWVERYVAEGVAGLVDHSRRPATSPNRTPMEVEARVLALRLDHPRWGGRKLRKVLEWEGMEPVPAASTITEILRRHGVLDGPRAGEARGFVRFEHPEPNDLWQMDFKGHFPTDSGRCHALTVLDDHSRYSLEIGACANEREATVHQRLELVFRCFGLPRRILADNGQPWGNGYADRYTRLAVWLLDLGIGLIHGRPYHPQTQGKDERFHRTLKGEVLDGRRFRGLEEVQAAFDEWREVYNCRRPHEAIGMATPASRYRPSAQDMPAVIKPPEYEHGTPVRMVNKRGCISFGNRKIQLFTGFVGRAVALRPTNTDGVFDVCYRSHVVGQLDLRQNGAEGVHHVSEHPSTLSPV